MIFILSLFTLGIGLLAPWPIKRADARHHRTLVKALRRGLAFFKPYD